MKQTNAIRSFIILRKYYLTGVLLGGVFFKQPECTINKGFLVRRIVPSRPKKGSSKDEPFLVYKQIIKKIKNLALLFPIHFYQE